ncbi:MAG: hypothetical protein HFJ10_11015, partial [Lachnospiraceae bacterium]|nr:hypothetical protein [Lachnospiraceae bacterium]
MVNYTNKNKCVQSHITKTNNFINTVKNLNKTIEQLNSINFNISGLSSKQLNILVNDLPAAELQSYINKIKEINNVDYGDFDTSQIQNYANALSDLAPTQTALLLSAQGLSNAKIQETLAAQGLTDTQQYEAFSNAGLLKSKVSLTAAESQYAIQKAFITEMSQADAAAKASETMASLGLSAALQGEGTETVKLTAKKLAQLVEQKKLTDAQAKEIAIRVGLTNSIKSQATSAIPAWIANIKAMTIATWDQIKATAVWLATTPAGWATAAVGAIAAVIGGMTIYKKHLESIRQATAESANAYKETSSSIDGYVSKYQELHQALLDAKGNEEETYNIKKQLLDLQTELNDKFGEEYGKLNLVTDAYKNHSEAIKAYSKDAAQSFLNNTGEKGIKDAKKQMLDDKNYVLGMGVSLYSEEGLAIQELADKYGIHMNPDESSGTFSLMLKADAATAESTINDFMSDVRNLRDSGDFDFTDPFDHVLEYSNGELQRVQDTIEQFGNTLQQILIAEITKDDDDLSRKYQKAIEAIEAYNDAILKSEDPFHDESVKKYRQDLEAAKAAFSTEELEDYGYVIHDVFDQADTNLLDFYDKLQNDSGLQKFAEQLKGFDRISLESMADAKNNNAFNSLITAADEYELEVNDLIDLLIKLGIAQDDISSATPGFEDSSWDYTTTLQNLDKVKEKLEVLEQSYTKLFDANNSISFEDLSSISEAFSDVDGIEDYIKRIQDAGENTEEVGQIFGELTGAYLDHSGILSHVTDENKNLIISMLDEMGIANAEEIVLAQLNAQHEILALQKQFVAEKGHELANATLEEITQFLTEANVSDITRQALAQLALEKINFSNINFNEAGNIAQLISLANAAGASAQAVATAKAALNTLSDINKNGANGTAADFHRLDNASLTLQQIKDKTYDWNYQKLDPNDFIVTNSPQYTPRYSIPNTGLSNTGSAIDNSREEAEQAAQQAQDTFEKSINFFEQRVKVLEDAFDNLEKGMKNVFGADAKNTLLTAQIGVLDEEVNNYTDALSMYRQKADEALSGIDSDLRDKIVNGAVQLTDFMGKGNEDIVEAIEAYQDWAGKVADCT